MVDMLPMVQIFKGFKTNIKRINALESNTFFKYTFQTSTDSGHKFMNERRHTQLTCYTEEVKNRTFYIYFFLFPLRR